VPQMGNLTGDIGGEEGRRHQQLSLDTLCEQCEKVSGKASSFWHSSLTEAQTTLPDTDLVSVAQRLPHDALPVDKCAIDAAQVANHRNALL
jgi:hypothetical protein